MNEVSLKTIVPELGRIVRLVRETSGKNLDTVSKSAGISISMLSQIERGIVSPSIDTLVMVCGALGIDIAELFRKLSPESPVRVHKRGERLTVENGGVRYEQLMTGGGPSCRVELFLIEIPPGCATAMSGGGHEGSEMGYILSGNALLTAGGQEYRIAGGDSVFFDARLPHRLANAGDGAFTAVWSISPPHVDYFKLGGPGSSAPDSAGDQPKG